MATVSRTPRVRKPLAPVGPVAWQWHRKPVWPCEIVNDGIPGLLEIAGVVYDVACLVPGGFCLRNHLNGEHYTIDTMSEPWSCECADFTYRREPTNDPQLHDCKHLAALKAALAWLWRADA